MKNVFLNFKKVGVTFLSLFAITGALVLSSCSDDDPSPVNEEEVITTLLITLTPQGGGDVVTIEFYDEDGDGPLFPQYEYVNGTTIGNAANLASGKMYDAVIQLFNGDEEVTSEIEDEAEDHIFCFTETGVDLNISNLNKDSNLLDVGLTSTWAPIIVGAATNSGTIQIELKHQPGEKDGSCDLGETDISVEFNVSVAD